MISSRKEIAAEKERLGREGGEGTWKVKAATRRKQENVYNSRLNSDVTVERSNL